MRNNTTTLVGSLAKLIKGNRQHIYEGNFGECKCNVEIVCIQKIKLGKTKANIHKKLAQFRFHSCFDDSEMASQVFYMDPNYIVVKIYYDVHHVLDEP